MRTLFLALIVIFLVSCANQGLPTAGTMETGDTVKTPRQYEEFCERDTSYDLCPGSDYEIN